MVNIISRCFPLLLLLVMLESTIIIMFLFLDLKPSKSHLLAGRREEDVRELLANDDEFWGNGIEQAGNARRRNRRNRGRQGDRVREGESLMGDE